MSEIYLMTRPREITTLEYRSRFSMEEKSAIYTKAKTDVVVQSILDDLSATQGGVVNLDDSRIRQALDYFVSVGLIAQERIDEILSYAES